MPRLYLNALAEAMKCVAAEKREADAAAVMASLLGPRAAGPIMLLWLCRNLDAVQAWGNIPLPDLLSQAMDAVGAPASGENLKAQKQLRELFQDREWLERALDSLDHGQRESFVARLFVTRGWPEADKRSVLAAIIKLFPDLSKVVAGDSAEPAGKAERRLTSWRSYRGRQGQLKKLIEVTIPENSREIAVGRSYGDLRENFEYQTAKDRQRLLLRRKRELEDDLDSVRGTDFRNAPVDKAGQGTCVKLQRPDGRTESFCILGEWDRDERLGIIANRSKLAEGLAGHRAGETVPLPGAGGEEPCRILQVSELTDEIRAWMAADGQPS
jgi:transcription elongation GreA/GreB family factor